MVEIDERERLLALRRGDLELDLVSGSNLSEIVQSRRMVGDVLVDTAEPHVVASHLSCHLLDDGGQLSISQWLRRWRHLRCRAKLRFARRW